mgnify:FL=1
MLKKSPQIILIISIFFAVFNFDFQAIEAGFSSAGYSVKSVPLVSQVQAKKKANKKTKKAKKLSKNKAGENIEIPIVISGDSICQENTKQILKLLFEKDKDNFQLVVSNLGKIECAVSGSGVFPWENPARFKVGVATSNAEPIWYAGVLVHESCHIEQFKIKEEYSGEKAEIECLGVQIGSLEKLEAGQSKIDYVKNIAQSRYWLVDIKKRWW